METKHKTFKPFDKVLVRDSQDVWQIDFYSHWNKDYAQHVILSYGDGVIFKDKDILPYEGNEHLLGTLNMPEEEFKKDEYYVFLDTPSLYIGISGIFGTVHYVTRHRFVRGGMSWEYAIPLSKFNPNDLEETKKHILCVKKGRVVRYKE